MVREHVLRRVGRRLGGAAKIAVVGAALAGTTFFGKGHAQEAGKSNQVQAQKNEAEKKQVEVHIEIGCSDGREVGDIYNKALKDIAEKSEENGVHLDFQRLSIPGTFYYPGLEKELKRIIMTKNEQYSGRDVKYYVHMKSHADVTPLEGHEKTFSLRDVKFTPGQPVNCGMIGAGPLAAEVEDAILKLKPTVVFGGKKFVLDSERALTELNHQAYGTNQLLAGMVESFNEPARHIRTQKSHLRDALERDPFLVAHNVEITAGVHNYNNYRYVRVDGRKDIPYTAIDAVHERAMQLFDDEAKRDPNSPQVKGRVQGQEPSIILFHHAGIPFPRKQALEAIGQEGSLVGKVFASSTTVLEPHEPLAVPKILGIYYAAIHYPTARTLMVMGNTEGETDALMRRLENDPYFQAVTKVLADRGITLKKVAHTIPRTRLLNQRVLPQKQGWVAAKSRKSQSG